MGGKKVQAKIGSRLYSHADRTNMDGWLLAVTNKRITLGRRSPVAERSVLQSVYCVHDQFCAVNGSKQ